MAQSRNEIEDMIMEAAEMFVEEVCQFWGLEPGSLTLEDMIDAGKGPLNYPSPLEFQAAVEMLAIAKGRAQQEARATEEPPEEPTQEAREQAAQELYERRVREAKTPEECFALHRENEELLAAEHKAERDAITARAEKSFALRERARKAQVTTQRGISEEDEHTVRRGDEFVEPADKKQGRSQELPSDPDELYKLWQAEGGKVPGPSGGEK